MSIYSAAILSDSPLAFWRLGDAVGPNALDSSPNARTATYTGTPTLGEPSLLPVDLDKSVLLNGTTQYVACGNGAHFQLSAGTIEAWVKTTQAGTFRGIIVKQLAYSMFLHNGVLIAYDWGGAAIRSSGVTINDGIRHHVAFAFGAGTGQLYVDGQPAGASFAYAVSAQTVQLLLGYGNTAGQFLSGHVDEAAVYGTKFAAERILAHYNTAFVKDLIELDASYIPRISKAASHTPRIDSPASYAPTISKTARAA